MAERSCLAVILAAGEGTRMRSATPKVLHPVGGLPLLGHVLASATAVGADRIAVVVGPNAEGVRHFLGKRAEDAAVHEQRERLGTAHAVLAAGKELKGRHDDLIVLYGDTPLIRPQTLKRVRQALARGADLAVLGFHASEQNGYGRLIIENRQLVAIREVRDATAAEKAITPCNSGVMAMRLDTVAPLLKKIGNDNAKAEYYLTDIVALANGAGRKAVVIVGDEAEFLGVNSRKELAAAERAFQDRARAAALAGGVTLTAPETVFLSHDTRIGRDVVIEPNVFLGPGVHVDSGAVIHAYSHIVDTRIGSGAHVGPFARLRGGAVVGADARIGNFVELKNTDFGAGAKANHLAYLGDATVGTRANIGAGAITCNYDGFAKHRTGIGEGAFIGSNSALVAPVTIGEGAYIASGSVITRNVEPDAMAIARGRQENKPEWARRLREKRGGG